MASVSGILFRVIDRIAVINEKVSKMKHVIEQHAAVFCIPFHAKNIDKN